MQKVYKMNNASRTNLAGVLVGSYSSESSRRGIRWRTLFSKTILRVPDAKDDVVVISDHVPVGTSMLRCQMLATSSIPFVVIATQSPWRFCVQLCVAQNPPFFRSSSTSAFRWFGTNSEVSSPRVFC